MVGRTRYHASLKLGKENNDKLCIEKIPLKYICRTNMTVALKCFISRSQLVHSSMYFIGIIFSTEQFVTVVFWFQWNIKLCSLYSVFQLQFFFVAVTASLEQEKSMTNNTQNDKTWYFFNNFKIALKFRKKISSELLGTVTNSDEQ